MMSNDKKKPRKLKCEKQALKLLSSPDFHGQFLDEIARQGLIGEEENAVAIYVAGTSRVLRNPLNILVKGASSSGKNFLVNRVLQFFPKESVRELTSSSATALHYSGAHFRNKIVYLQERNEGAGAMHPMRLLISEGKLIRAVTEVVGRKRTTTRYEARGPVACISTTTKKKLEIDDETRHVSIWIDESEAQTIRILRAMAARTGHKHNV